MRTPAPPQTAQLLPVLANPRPGELWLLIAPLRIREIELGLIPMLALAQPVHVIVGGHSYDVDGVLRGVRKLTPDVETVRKRIRQRRAPTAFQMRALLKNTPETTDPIIVLNFLIHYFDDDEELWKSRYLLKDSIDELHRLSQLAPVVVTAQPPPPNHQKYIQLFELLRGMTDNVIELEYPSAPQQLRLF